MKSSTVKLQLTLLRMMNKKYDQGFFKYDNRFFN